MSKFSSFFKPYLNWSEKYISGREQAASFDLNIKKNYLLNGIVTYGMGGSAIAGKIASEILQKIGFYNSVININPLMPVHKKLYDNHLQVFFSHSGNTWETIDGFEKSNDKQLRLIVCSGGKLSTFNKAQICIIKASDQPRQDLPTFLGFLFGLLKKLNPETEPAEQEILSNIDFLTKNNDKLMKNSEFIKFAKNIDFFNIFGMSSDSCSAAYRIQTQLNENSKKMAIFTPLTEGFHNLLASYKSSLNLGVIFANTNFLPKKVDFCLKNVKKMLSDLSIPLYSVPILGDNWLRQFLSMIIWADFASVALAVECGQDPNSIELIERLKILNNN